MGVLSSKVLTHLGGQIVVHDIFEVHLIKVVCPWVEDREALVLDTLSPVLLDVFTDEFEVSLISGDRVGQVVLINLLLGVSNKGSNGLDARLGLEVLRLDLGVDGRSDGVVAGDSEGLEDSDEHLL